MSAVNGLSRATRLGVSSPLGRYFLALGEMSADVCKIVCKASLGNVVEKFSPHSLNSPEPGEILTDNTKILTFIFTLFQLIKAVGFFARQR
jgi:hypothetical protein